MKTKTIIIIIAFLFAIGINANAQKKIKLLKELKDYTLIPEGKVIIDTLPNFYDDTAVNPMKKRYTGCRYSPWASFKVDAFYISKYEVSNKQYREFLDSLMKNNEIDKLKIAQIDSIQWNKLYPSEPLINNYHRHPAYNEYPVVNISYEGAIMYCEWLTAKYNTINKDKSIEYKFALPTKQQWIRAARGNTENVYAWEGYHIMKKYCLCNFYKAGSENIHYNYFKKKVEINRSYIIDKNNTEEDLTAPVKSYWPNMFGVYNMCGNAAEMILEKGIAIGGSYNDLGYDVRVESIQSYQGATPFIGFRPVMIVIKK